MIDTNIALDFLTMMQPFYDDARNVIGVCASENVRGFIVSHHLPNVFILRKSHSEISRRKMLNKLCLVLQAAGASHEHVCNAIKRDDFPDFEVYLEDKCAEEISADFIVTGNVEDLPNSATRTALFLLKSLDSILIPEMI